MTQQLQPLKEKTLEQLKKGYQTVCRWTILREGGSSEKSRVEYQRGIVRIEEYETELRERGLKTTDLHHLYLNSLDIAKDSKEMVF